jgi:hypothetical protein
MIFKNLNPFLFQNGLTFIKVKSKKKNTHLLGNVKVNGYFCIIKSLKQVKK